MFIEPITTKGNLIEGVSTGEDEKLNPAQSTSSEILRYLMRNYFVPKMNVCLPLVLFLAGKLYHGNSLIDSTKGSLMNLKDTIELKEQEFTFNRHTLDWMPLEARVTIEISSIYNTAYVHKLGLVSFAVFDGFGILNTGIRVILADREISDLESGNSRRYSWNGLGRIFCRRAG